MSWIKRPNDVWLRIWLILIWIAAVAIDWAVITPWTNRYIREEWVWLQPFLYTIVVTMILFVVFDALKRPDCKCWDDIKTTENTVQSPSLVGEVKIYERPVPDPPLIVHDCSEDKQARATKLAGKRKPAVRKKRGDGGND